MVGLSQPWEDVPRAQTPPTSLYACLNIGKDKIIDLMQVRTTPLSVRATTTCIS
jgi:hypothetical protein